MRRATRWTATWRWPSALNEYNKATGQVPERDQAQVYGQDGWKPVSQKVNEAAGVASVPDSATE